MPWRTCAGTRRWRWPAGDNAGAAILIGMLHRGELTSQYHMEEAQIEAVMTNAAKGLALLHRPEAIKI